MRSLPAPPTQCRTWRSSRNKRRIRFGKPARPLARAPWRDKKKKGERNVTRHRIQRNGCCCCEPRPQVIYDNVTYYCIRTWDNIPYRTKLYSVEDTIKSNGCPQEQKCIILICSCIKSVRVTLSYDIVAAIDVYTTCTSLVEYMTPGYLNAYKKIQRNYFNSPFQKNSELYVLIDQSFLSVVNCYR